MSLRGQTLTVLVPTLSLVKTGTEAREPRVGSSLCVGNTSPHGVTVLVFNQPSWS